jgi:hypothetical protein
MSAATECSFAGISRSRAFVALTFRSAVLLFSHRALKVSAWRTPLQGFAEGWRQDRARAIPAVRAPPPGSVGYPGGLPGALPPATIRCPCRAQDLAHGRWPLRTLSPFGIRAYFNTHVAARRAPPLESRSTAWVLPYRQQAASARSDRL